jgi:uncharacterized protein YkwD
MAAIAPLVLASAGCLARAEPACERAPSARDVGGEKLALVPRFGGAAGDPGALPGDTQLEAEMLELLQRDRARHGLRQLTLDPELVYLARLQAYDMATYGYAGHHSPRTGTFKERLDRAGYLRRVARENAARSYTVERGQANFMASPPHRANLLAVDVTHVGVGIVPRLEGLYIVQVLAAPVLAPSQRAVEASVQARLQATRRRAGLRPLARSATLQAVADEEIAYLRPDFGEAHAEAISSRASHAAQCRALADVGSVLHTSLRTVREGESLRIPAAAGRDQAVAYGLATREVSDREGRPRVVVVLLLGGERQVAEPFAPGDDDVPVIRVRR